LEGAAERDVSNGFAAHNEDLFDEECRRGKIPDKVSDFFLQDSGEPG
jgi:hypothetical protein